MIKFLFLLALLIPQISQGAWPDEPWLNNTRPKATAEVYAVAFGSPFDFQFIKILSVWKRLEKKYKDFGAEFLIVAQPENSLPFSSNIVKLTAAARLFSLPVYIDYGGTYSKKWRAYVTPTIDLVLKNEKVVSFDPGYFDPSSLEKALQKALKEAGAPKLPAKDYTEADSKNCGHGSTFFLGKKQRSVWGKDPVEISGPWTEKEDYLEKDGPQVGQITVGVKDSNLAIVAESTNNTSQQIKVTIEQGHVPPNAKGADLQESKTSETVINVKDLRLYEVLASQETSPKNFKVTLQSPSKNLRIWALQTLPHCRNFK